MIFIASRQPVHPDALQALRRTLEDEEAHVSQISAWEIGLLVSRGRIALPSTPLAWFQNFASRRGVAVDNLSPEILIASSFLPGDPPNDPADRIIAATARDLGYRVMTRDAKLLRYAAAGHVDAIAC
jgi:PIN domain nuclease of toxin-antitoxin system